MRLKRRLLMSAIGAAAISLCAVAPMFAQDGGAGDIPELEFRLVQDFFHYPPGSVIGRTTGMTVGPDGEILGAFGRRGRMPGTIDSVHQIACPDENTLYLAHTYASRFDKWVAE